MLQLEMGLVPSPRPVVLSSIASLGSTVSFLVSVLTEIAVKSPLQCSGRCLLQGLDFVISFARSCEISAYADQYCFESTGLPYLFWMGMPEFLPGSWRASVGSPFSGIIGKILRDALRSGIVSIWLLFGAESPVFRLPRMLLTLRSVLIYFCLLSGQF